ncbi:MAG: hypothetical protein INR69_12160 [Mucilaginibacter polytrichastri]|nr:hypothetical protein [Mucilaginibacter polytrichastri]
MDYPNRNARPEAWKWGIIYVNTDDPRIVVPKRNPGFGWTFNFAHWQSYLITVLILAIPFLIRFFVA